MRPLSLALLAAAVLAVSATAATTTPTYVVTYSGAGVEHQTDNKSTIQDNTGLCNAAEHIDVTANVVWSASWPRFRAGTRSAAAGPAAITGSSVEGTDVKDACGLDPSQAPPDWLGQTSCSAPLVSGGSASMALGKTKTSLLLAFAAPLVAVPVGAGCSLNIRADQFTAHVVVPLKKLDALRKHGSLVLRVGTATPGPGDDYAPSLDCSQPIKPYEGYRIADECHDDLTWSGTVRVTRAT